MKPSAKATNKSGRDVGAEYGQRVARYLDQTSELPLLPSGAVNVTAIADAAQVPRQSLYKNPAIRARVEEAVKAAGLQSQRALDPKDTTVRAPRPSEAAQAKQALERRVNRLEQQNAALVAENAELRRQLKEFRLAQGREDMAIETGRRIVAP